MTTNVIKDFISSMQDSGKSTLQTIQEISVKESKILPLLQQFNLKSKFNYMPVNEVPTTSTPGSSLHYVIGNLELQKKLKNTIGTLTDETEEDIKGDIESALLHILGSQTKLQAEQNIVEDLVSASDTISSTAKSKNVNTLLYMLTKFPTKVSSAIGTYVAVMSMNTYIELMSTLTIGVAKLIEDGMLTIVPAIGIDNDKLMVLHTAGCGYGLTINSLEEERENNSSKLVTSYSYAANACSGYAKILSVHSAGAFQ